MKNVLIGENLLPEVKPEESLLRREEFRVFSASSAEEALNILRSGKIDLMVVDLDMPRMGGDKLCSIVREEKACGRVFVILVCSGRKLDLLRCDRCGADSYLTRPLEPAAVFDKISHLLGVPRRKDRRVLVRIAVNGRFRSKPFFCGARDLSASGIRFEADKTLAKGDIITCSFFIPDGERIEAEGEVVRVVYGEAKAYNYGVRFTSLAPEAKTAIEEFVRRQTAEENALA